MGPLEVYETTGDSEAAMRLMASERTKKNSQGPESSPQEEYNSLLLTGLATTTASDKNTKSADSILSLLDESLQDARRVVQHSHESMGNLRQKAIEDWILAYNRGLVLLSKGEVSKSIRLAWSYLSPVLKSSDDNLLPNLELVCRMCFLLLEGMLTLYPTRSHGRTSSNSENYESVEGNESSFDLELLDVVLAWVTEHVELTKGSTSSSNTETSSAANADTASPDPQLKFLLSLYQSRVNFFERSNENLSVRDKHMRSARKELKQAMEIFQHKLRPEKSDTSSVGTFSSYGEEMTANDPSGGQSPVPWNKPNTTSLSRILGGQNQAALNLKANAEQLKGNVKKSLILCGEAQSFTNSGNNNNNDNNISEYYDAIHQNNLGIVYESSGKSHLALHAFSKAVKSASANHNRFETDGRATPGVTLHILNNAALCALKSRNFQAAYECYAIGLATCHSWRKRPLTWLRLNEACIGLHARLQNERAATDLKCSGVEVEGQPKGVLLMDTTKHSPDSDNDKELPPLGSQEDLKGVRDYPIQRARMALKMALELFGEGKDTSNADLLALQSARLSYAYVCLEQKEYQTALDYALLVLNDSGQLEQQQEIDLSKKTTLQRQTATAKMYASEAYAILGDPMASMKVLVGDGKDDAFDRLSSDLGGVTLGMASANQKAKSRLAKAQTMVRCSASAASSALGNSKASKQLAMSAQAMENSYAASREGTSQARKALIYCMLREGNHGAALTLLRSAR